MLHRRGEGEIVHDLEKRREGVCDEPVIGACAWAQLAEPLVQGRGAAVPDHDVEVAVHADDDIPRLQDCAPRNGSSWHVDLELVSGQVSDADQRDVAVRCEVVRAEWMPVDQINKTVSYTHLRAHETD